MLRCQVPTPVLPGVVPGLMTSVPFVPTRTFTVGWFGMPGSGAQVPGPLLARLGGHPGDPAILLELDHVVLPDGALGQRHLEQQQGVVEPVEEGQRQGGGAGRGRGVDVAQANETEHGGGYDEQANQRPAPPA